MGTLVLSLRPKNNLTSKTLSTHDCYFTIENERSIAALLWLISIPTSFLGAVFIWDRYKKKSTFIDQQGKDFLNFWISYFIYPAIISYMIGTDKIFILFVLITLPIKIVGAINAAAGRRFKPPLTIRFFK